MQTSATAATAQPLCMLDLVKKHGRFLALRDSTAKPDDPHLAWYDVYLTLLPLATKIPPSLELLEASRTPPATDNPTVVPLGSCVYSLMHLWADVWPIETAGAFFSCTKLAKLEEVFVGVAKTLESSAQMSVLLQKGNFNMKLMRDLLSKLAADTSYSTNHLLRFSLSAIRLADDYAQEAIFLQISRTLPNQIEVERVLYKRPLIQKRSELSDQMQTTLHTGSLRIATGTYDTLAAEHDALCMHVFTPEESAELKTFCASLECAYMEPDLLYLYVWNFEALLRMKTYPMKEKKKLTAKK